MRRGTWVYVAALLVAGSAAEARAQQEGAAGRPVVEPRGQGAASGGGSGDAGEGTGIEGDGGPAGESGTSDAAPAAAPAPAPAPGDAQVTPPPTLPPPASTPDVAQPSAPQQDGAREPDETERDAMEPPAPGTGFGAPPAPAGNGGAGPEAAAPARRPLRIGGGAQAQGDAWRQLIEPQVDTAERAQIAAEQLAAAEVALGQGDAESARAALQLATQTIEAIYEGAPGAALASGLGDYASRLSREDAAAVDLQPLVVQVEAMRAVLPPEVVTQVQDAQRQVRSGDAAAAARSLLGARALVYSDFGLLPAEEAFARSRAALAELEAGNVVVARNLVQGVPAAIAELRTAAPLVPVRLRLRAAAGQASARNWADAEVLLNEAAAELDQMRLQASPALARRIDPLSARLAVLQERIAAGTQPSASRIRQLADAAGGVPAG